MSRFLPILIVVALSAMVSALPGPGPGQPFGGDDSGCVPVSSAGLKCSFRISQALRGLTNAASKCHSRFATARFKEVVLDGNVAADDAPCEAAAGARFDATLAALTLSTSCAGSTALALAATEKQTLLADQSNPLSFDALAGSVYCDATLATPLSPGGDDAGYVPATKNNLKCADKLIKQLAKLGAAVRKCHAKAADAGFDLKDPPFDQDLCEANALAKFDRATATTVDNGLCPACLSAADQYQLGVDAIAQLAVANAVVYPCPDPVLHLETLQLDRPTLLTLGVQLLISGDENHNASVSMRYRQTGFTPWRDALPLMRVRPEIVSGHPVPQQFAGSIFDLRPATSYQIEVHALDPDGAVDQTMSITGTTRDVPGDPQTPNPVAVDTSLEFAAALAAAQPGDVITLAAGTYFGPFDFDASGTAENPIVIRGASQAGVIIDGDDCTDCNVLEVYGSFVHIERLTLQSANRALRFQSAGAEGNVVRHVHTLDTTLGIGARQDQLDFYICDNVLEGRLVWPHVYSDDDGLHSNDDGIRVEGRGHVVCHNQVIGFGDALKTEQVGARAIDFYGNEVLSAYDNGVELDVSEGNVRAFRNRFTNNYTPISVQPIYGGPAYVFRNVAVNVADEQMKFHGLGDGPGPSGVLAYHNTFVSPALALQLSTNATSRYFSIENNLFVGPAVLEGTRTVDWLGPIEQGLFDYNGYFPDGIFRFNLPPWGLTSFTNFAGLQAGGMESNGRLLAQPIFANGLVAPSSYVTILATQDVTLDPNSVAVDGGAILANLTDDYTGSAPDLGALERGCPLPIYGVRPDGVDESNQPLGCVP